MYPEVQLPTPNGSLGHTRGQVNCAMARSKALINAGMPVYFVWNRKSHISNGTAKSVGSHSVSNIRCHGISVEDCATTEILVCSFDAVPGPGTYLSHDNRADQNAVKSCVLSSNFKQICVLHLVHSSFECSCHNVNVNLMPTDIPGCSRVGMQSRRWARRQCPGPRGGSGAQTGGARAPRFGRCAWPPAVTRAAPPPRLRAARRWHRRWWHRRIPPTSSSRRR